MIDPHSRQEQTFTAQTKTEHSIYMYITKARKNIEGSLKS